MIGFSVGTLLTKMEGPPTTPVPNAMKPVGEVVPWVVMVMVVVVVVVVVRIMTIII